MSNNGNNGHLAFRPLQDISSAGDLDAWIIPGVLARGLSMISGPPKAGKSWFVGALAGAVADAVPYGHCLPARITGRVLLLSGENSPAVVKDRQMRLYHPLVVDESDLLVCVNPGSLRLPDEHERLREAIAAWRPELVVLDPIRRFYVGKESDNDEVGELTRWFLGVCAEFNTSIVYVHHTRFDGAKARGATDWDAAPDCLLRCEAAGGDDETCKLSVYGEARNTEPPTPHAFYVPLDGTKGPLGQCIEVDPDEYRHLREMWAHFGLEFAGPLTVRLSPHAERLHGQMMAHGGTLALGEIEVLSSLAANVLTPMLSKLVAAGYVLRAGTGDAARWTARSVR